MRRAGGACGATACGATEGSVADAFTGRAAPRSLVLRQRSSRMITIRSAAARRGILRRVSLLICAGLLAAAPGCSKSAEPKPAPPVVVHHVPPDPTKWQLADLQAGLTTHDMRFVPAVLIFSMQSANGAKQADDLKGLLERAGQMKDDPSIALPLPPAPNATPVTAAKPVVPGQP